MPNKTVASSPRLALTRKRHRGRRRRLLLESLEERNLLALDTLYLSPTSSGSVGVPSVSFGNEDILASAS